MMNISGLAYVVTQSTDLARWTSYAHEVLGMMSQTAPDGGLYLRMDERQFRIAVQPGTRDSYVCSGWEVANQGAFEQAIATLEQHKVSFERGDAALCALRKANGLVRFSDPSGNCHEVIWGFQSDFAHFNSPVGVQRFVTGNIGMGHTVLPAEAFAQTHQFVTEVMGFGLSDMFNFKPAGDAGPTLPIYFYHCTNARHHSLAIAGFAVESGCVHIMVEVPDVPEVGRALDRMLSHKVTQTATLGQHSNDKMISFYMRCPSNFDIEYGCGGAVHEWESHIAHEFTRVSLWGHDFSIGQAAPTKD